MAVNVADLVPKPTVTEPGRLRLLLSLVRETAAPPLGAACDKVTVQVEVPPLPRLADAHEIELSTGGAEGTREMVAPREAPL